MIHLYLGLLLLSFLSTSTLVIPFINLLYKLKFQKKSQKTVDLENKTRTTFDKLHSKKRDTPVGGGILIIGSVSILFLLIFPILKISNIFISASHNIGAELGVIFFTFISFGILGLYDDTLKFFKLKKSKFFGLKIIHKLGIQIILALIVSLLIYFKLGINFIYLPFLGPISLGLFFIPISMTFIIAFSNFFNITDGMDGLSCGLLMIALFAFWILSANSLDTPISMFIALWIGSLIAFLYFNVYPARIQLGDVGSLSFGATFAVLALILGKVIPLVIVGFLFIIEGLSSAIQLFYKKYLKRRFFPAAPLHLTFFKIGWKEPKIVTRAWLAGIILAIFGLWLGIN
ncbi:hypothetical protein KKE45_02320 [Patescibacteria group bacterium]|nr:hypothetical protein [Patescibacteria group bacterium]